ncbi:MAG: signal peptidase II [Polyangiaceae bacterium]
MSDPKTPEDATDPGDGDPEAEPTEQAGKDGSSDEGSSTSDDKPRRRRRRRAESSRGDDTAPDEEDPAPKHPAPSYVFLGVASVIFLAADLLTKWWALSRLSGGPDKKIVVIKGLWQFNLARNKGGAWGLLGDQPDYVRLPFFFLISAIAVAFIVSLYRKLEPRQVALKWALPLVLGGALGNLTDRIRHQHVVDFIDWFVTMSGKESHWPTFNVADIWIVVGVGLMAVDMFTPRRKPRRRRSSANQGSTALSKEAGEEQNAET